MAKQDGTARVPEYFYLIGAALHGLVVVRNKSWQNPGPCVSRQGIAQPLRIRGIQKRRLVLRKQHAEVTRRMAGQRDGQDTAIT